MLPILQECLLFHFAGPGRSILSPFLIYLFVLQLSHYSPPSQLCNVFAFPGFYQWCCRSCQSLHLSEMSLAHILERSSVGICLVCVGLVLLLWNSQRILLLCCLFHFLFMRKPTPVCPLLASEWYSRWPLWRVVKLSSFLPTSPSPITSHFMLFSSSSSSSSCTCSYFSNVLTLYVVIFGRPNQANYLHVMLGCHMFPFAC